MYRSFLYVPYVSLCVSGKECEDIYRRGGKDSQMYLIQPDAFTVPYKVFCDQSTQNGGESMTQSGHHLTLMF